MQEETQAAPTGQTEQQETRTDAAPTVDATGQEKAEVKTVAATFTQEDVDRIVKERLQRAQETADKAAKRATAEAEAKVLAEQGKYKELYDKLQAEAAAKEAELKAARMENVRIKVAGKLNLPAALVDRLKGETEEELEADAKSLLAALPKPAAPNINNQPGDGGAPKGNALSDADRQMYAAIYGVDPKYFNMTGA